MRLTHSTTSGNTRSSSRLRSTTSSLASPRGSITYLPPSSVRRAANGHPARCPNPNTCEVKPYFYLATGTEHSSLSSVFAHRPDPAVQRHFRPVSAPEASSHRHWHFREAPQATRRRRRGHHRLWCVAGIWSRPPTGSGSCLRLARLGRSLAQPSTSSTRRCTFSTRGTFSGPCAVRWRTIYARRMRSSWSPSRSRRHRPHQDAREHVRDMEKFFEVGRYGTASSTAASWRPRTLRCKSTRERVPLVVPSPKRPAEADDEGACEQTWKTSGKVSAGGHHSAATVEEEMTLGASTFREARVPPRCARASRRARFSRRRGGGVGRLPRRRHHQR
jgi:hypothetical protein